MDVKQMTDDQLIVRIHVNAGKMAEIADYFEGLKFDERPLHEVDQETVAVTEEVLSVYEELARRHPDVLQIQRHHRTFQREAQELFNSVARRGIVRT